MSTAYEVAKAHLKKKENTLRQNFIDCLEAGISEEEIAGYVGFSVEGMYAFIEYQGEDPI